MNSTPSTALSSRGAKRRPKDAFMVLTFQMRRDNLASLGAGYDRHDFKANSCASPVQNPLLKQPKVVTLHQLETTAEVRLDPAIDVPEAFGYRSAAVSHTLIDRHHVVIAKSFDDHEQHVESSSREFTNDSSICSTCTGRRQTDCTQHGRGA